MQSELNALGHFPIIQTAGALLVLAIIGAAAFKALRDAKSVQASPKTELYLDGSFKRVTELLERMTAALERSPVDRDLFNEWVKEIEAKISEAKRRIFDEIDERVKTEAHERKELEARLRGVEQELAGIRVRLSMETRRRS